MSGQWEVVTKKRDKGSKLPVPKANNSKEIKNNKNVLNGVKIEEVLPKSQVQNLYGSKAKENKVPDKNKPKENVKKAAVKKEKPVEPSKPKPPKSIESALNAIDVNEFKDIYEKNINHFPDAPIVWLKELVQYLNQKVPFDDSTFSSKPLGYPLNVVPSGLTSIIEKVIKESGKNNTQLFFDICLASMATDMSKGLPSIGYKIFLQYISLQEPNLVMANIQKHVTLKNSYQNRPNIGLSILWGISHVGYKDFTSGLLVFQELFLPLIDMKNYSRYVLTYLTNLIKNNNEKSLSLDELLSILNIAYSNRKNMPNDLMQELSLNVSSLKPSVLKKLNSYSVEVVLKNVVLNNNVSYQNYLCDVLLEMFHKDQSTLIVWNKAYHKNVLASAILLEYMSNNWSTVSKKINKGALNNLLSNLNSLNLELSSKKRKEEGLKSSVAAIEKIQEKMLVKKKRGFPYKLLVLLMLTLGGLLYLDIKQHGGWNGSLTRKALKDYKVCEYSHVAIDRVKGGLRWSSEKIEEQFPGLQQTVVTFSEPYVELCVNLGKIGRNILCNVKDNVVAKYPLVVQSVESYVPGLVENSQKAVTDVYVTSALYLNRGVDYLKNEVFVGQLSPENMQRVVIEAFNTTQQKATEYYHWIYKKVQTSIK